MGRITKRTDRSKMSTGPLNPVVLFSDMTVKNQLIQNSIKTAIAHPSVGVSYITSHHTLTFSTNNH